MKKIIINIKESDILKTFIAIIVAVVFMIVGFLVESDILNLNFIMSNSLAVKISFGIAFIVGGYAKAVEGVEKTIENKALNVEFLMIIAALGAFILGDFFEATILILIFAISGLLEEYVESKSKKTLTELLTLTPQQALLLKDNEEITINASELKLNDVVVVKVGMQIPADGIVIKGETNVDQSLITGESIPVLKSENKEVFAGSTNLLANIHVKITVDPKDSLAERISLFVKEAQETKTKKETAITAIEKYYVYIILLIGILTIILPPLFNIWGQDKAFRIGITVFVVASPCALVASVTPAILSSISNAVKNQALVKGGAPITNLNKMDVVVFDKTGTITEGKPMFVNLKIADGYNIDEVINNLVSIEIQSTHPLAKAIIEHYDDIEANQNVETKEVAGNGMETTINNDVWKIGKFSYKENLLEDEINLAKKKALSIVNIIKNDKVIAFVTLKDALKKNAKKVVAFFNDRNIKTVLLTGDHDDIARNIASEVGFAEYIANTLPMEKSSVVERLQKEGNSVLMIGDGINDAPALAIADIAIAMGNGADVSMNTADIIIIDSKLEKLPKLFNISKRLKWITTENIILSLTVITVLLIFNYLDKLDLPVGVVAHEVSTIIVILNGLRMLIDKKVNC